jgi:hypothetical protein
MTVWRMCVACWISKATRAQAYAHTLAHLGTYVRGRSYAEICNTYCSLRQQWVRERTSVLRYTYIVYLVCFLKCRYNSQKSNNTF